VNEPNKLKDLQTTNGGAKEEARTVEQWRAYKLWYNTENPKRNGVML